MSRSMVVLLLAALMLAGRLQAQTVSFAASLDGVQAVPPSGSAAGGQGVFTLEATGTLHGTVTTCGLAATAVHVHKGVPGVPGGIILSLGGGPLIWTGIGLITPAQQADLLAGLWYVDVHTVTNPGGEIRGQIRPSPRVFGAQLDGIQATPSHLGAATGGATLILEPGGTLSCVLKASGLFGTGAHLHVGAPGVPGASVFSLAGGPTQWSGTTPALSVFQIAQLQAGDWYVDVDTAAKPLGEIRGQILGANPCTLFADDFKDLSQWTQPEPVPLGVVGSAVGSSVSSGPGAFGGGAQSLVPGPDAATGERLFVGGTITSLPGLIDVTGRTDIVVTFRCNYVTHTTGTGSERRFVEFSNNGFDSANLGSLQLAGGGPSPGINACAAMGLWHTHVIAGTLTSAGGANVQMRFRFDLLQAGGLGGKGWTVDDVKIRWSVPCPEGDCGCDDEAAPLDENGEPVLPEEATEITDELVDEDMGLVEDLYPDADTSLDLWYEEDPCAASIGEEPLPEGTGEVDLDAELAALGITGVTAEAMVAQLAAWEDAIAAKVLLEPNLLASATIAPATPGPLPAVTGHVPVAGECYVLGGRDLVFVHGLQLGHVFAKIAGSDGANTKWKPPTQFPGSIENPEFYDSDGYFKEIAVKIWEKHIARFLTDKKVKNRYVIVPYSCAERLEVSAQSVLTQIGDAMRFGEGVEDPFDPDHLLPKPLDFGRPSFVILSHSTGGEIVDVALSVAASNPALKAGFVAEHCKAHIALHGALSGSRLATAAVVGAGFLADVTPGWVCPLVSVTILLVTGNLEPCPMVLTAFAESVLVDLVPAVAQLKWGSTINATPVRTVTVIGGHPSFLYPIKTVLLSGFDDGVANINSQSGNPNSTLFWPSGFVPDLPPPYSWIRVFDTGIALKGPHRVQNEFIEQVIDPPLQPGISLDGLLVSGGATPWVSPTGMLQPVGWTLESAFGGVFSTLNRYDNHFTFLMSASDHFGPNGSFGGFNGLNYKDTQPLTFKEKNWEETRVITDDRIYDPYEMLVPGDGEPLLVEGSEPKLREHVRGRLIQFKLFGKKFRWWVWKRRYHLLAGAASQQEMDYVYGYLLKTPGVGGACDPGWADMDCSLPGSFGPPYLEGTGTLAAGSDVTLDLTNALQVKPAKLLVSFTSNPVPFKGGTLCAFPSLTDFVLFTNLAGEIHLPFTWPSGIPAGLTFHAQMIVSDIGAVQDVAISNMIMRATE